MDYTCDLLPASDEFVSEIAIHRLSCHQHKCISLMKVYFKPQMHKLDMRHFNELQFRMPIFKSLKMLLLTTEADLFLFYSEAEAYFQCRPDCMCERLDWKLSESLQCNKNYLAKEHFSSYLFLEIALKLHEKKNTICIMSRCSNLTPCAKQKWPFSYPEHSSTWVFHIQANQGKIIEHLFPFFSLFLCIVSRNVGCDAIS